MDIHNNVLNSNNIFGGNMNTLSQSEQSENCLKQSANFGGVALTDQSKQSIQEPMSIHNLISGSILGGSNVTG